MKLHHVSAALLLAALVPAAAFAQDAKEQQKPLKTEARQSGQAERTPTPQELDAIKAWQANATPSEGHERLGRVVGRWKVHVKAYMQPDAPPAESEGTAEFSWVLGKRYVEERFRGSFMGQPYEGIGYTGYDNYAKKAVAVWMDTMGTGLFTATGTWSPEGALTLNGTTEDVVAKKSVAVTEATTFTDPDHFRFEMWEAPAGGQRHKSFEMDYTRVK